MAGLIPKPYKLFNKIQHYDWGTKNENAFIPEFLDIKIQKDIPYAELWIGAHPKAPSEIEVAGKRRRLNEIISEYHLECLGKFVSEKFGRKFPFLLKVLSAANALSIQTHPDKNQAEKLHKNDPINYPDDNHKPEIAIALDSLTAMAGFRPVKEIQNNLESLPELRNFVDGILIDKLLSAADEIESKKYISQVYSEIMLNADKKSDLSKCINQIYTRLKKKDPLSFDESQFMELFRLFGVDVGLFSVFFFNIIELKPREAIFTEAGVPHAYIKGNIVECMANSDNVVRAGLTNKFKDVKTLLEIIKYDFKKYEIIDPENEKEEIIYKTKAEEFEVSFNKKPAGFNRIMRTEQKPFVYLVTKGTIELNWNLRENPQKEIFSKGESLFIPANLDEYKISIREPAEYFTVGIP